MDEAIKGILTFFTQATADKALTLVGSLATLVAGLLIIRWLMRMLTPALRKSKIDQGVVSFVLNLISITLKVLLFAAVAIQLGVPSASFVTLMGSAGLAIGLALQGSLANLAGGVMLLLFHPFRVGHFIKAGSDDGVVQEIGLFYTTLKTFDGRTVVLPNGALSNGPITNFTQSPIRRIDVALTLPQGVDFSQVSRLALGVAASLPGVEDTPAPEARVTDIQNGILIVTVRAWAKQAVWWPTRLDLTEGILSALREAGIQLTPPITHVHLNKE
ncbi:MAG: mechanosensitive ion channel family protein [Christensenellales bacterium]|jgi:small conductance mechanosensitive channel